jgi:hypothetical protein
LDCLFSTGISYIDDAIVYQRIHSRKQCNAVVPVELPGNGLSQGSLYAPVQAPRRERFDLTGRLEHLANSAILEPQKRGVFAEAAACCRNAWFLPGATRPVSRQRIRARLAALLRPLAASENDWTIAEGHLKWLVGGLHPPVAPAAALFEWGNA